MVLGGRPFRSGGEDNHRLERWCAATNERNESTVSICTDCFCRGPWGVLLGYLQYPIILSFSLVSRLYQGTRTFSRTISINFARRFSLLVLHSNIFGTIGIFECVQKVLACVCCDMSHHKMRPKTSHYLVSLQRLVTDDFWEKWHNCLRGVGSTVVLIWMNDVASRLQRGFVPRHRCRWQQLLTALDPCLGESLKLLQATTKFLVRKLAEANGFHRTGIVIYGDNVSTQWSLFEICFCPVPMQHIILK